MDQQKWMDILTCHGSNLLKTVIGNSTSYDSDDENDDVVLFKLIKLKYNELVVTSRVPQSNRLLKPDPLVAMPPEMYRRSMNKMLRRQLFFKHLERRDLLYLQVLNSEDAESYKCLLLAKHGDLMQLDDLSIVVHFPKLCPELDLIRGDLHKFDLIRGAFWSCSVWERKLFVTMDTSIFNEKEKERMPKLGRITRKDLPYYVGHKKVGMTYAGYVQRSAGYKEEGYCMKQLNECLGIDTKRIYSSFNEWNGKTYPASEKFTELRKKLRLDPSTRRLLKSFDYFRSGNMFKALHYSNKAIAFNPDNIQARVTRGTVYANLGKMKKAFIDTEDCLKLDPKHESAKKQMSELLVAASKTHLLKGNYLSWHESLVLAKKYNPNNREAQELLTKSKYESAASTSLNPGPVTMLVPPSMREVAPIYNRVFPQVDKRRLLRQFRKQRKRKHKHHRRRRSERRSKSQKRSSTVGQPIPTTTTTRRQVFLRPGSPVFRRPFPPRSIYPRS